MIRAKIFSTAQDVCDFINNNNIPVENIVDIDMSCYAVGSAVKQKILVLYEEPRTYSHEEVKKLINGGGLDD